MNVQSRKLNMDPAAGQQAELEASQVHYETEKDWPTCPVCHWVVHPDEYRDPDDYHRPTDV